MKAAAVLALSALALVAVSSAGADTPTYSYYSGCTAFPVPDETQALAVHLIGAPGSDGVASGLGRGAGRGGAGADVVAFVRASAVGDTLYVSVGNAGDNYHGHFGHEQGGSAFNADGGNGGDGTDVRTGSCDGPVILVAGGGGGGGGYGHENGFTYTSGGRGGSADGADGDDGARGEPGGDDTDGAAGGGGAQGSTAGGRGTTDSWCTSVGEFVMEGFGGNGSTGGAGGKEIFLGDTSAGGGGGGGYGGGGGGDASCEHSGGGGGGGAGSSYADGSTVVGTPSFSTDTTRLAQVNISVYSPPVMTLLGIAPPANANGWRTGPVAVTWLCSPQDFPAHPVVEVVSTSGANQSVTGTCTGLAGTSSTDTQNGINIDRDPPTVDLSVLGTLGLAGWYVSNVVVKTQGSALSGIDTCTADQTFAADTTGTVVHGSCTSLAGLSADATPVTIKRDATPPTLASDARLGPGFTGAYTLGTWTNRSVRVTLTGSDAPPGSGLDSVFYGLDVPACTLATPASCSVYSAPLTLGSGDHVLKAFSRDVAGNKSALSTQSIRIDQVDPAVSVAHGSPDGSAGWFKSSPVAYTVTASDTPSGLVNGRPACTLDGAPYSLPPGGSPWSVALAGQGTHTLACTATDLAGNMASSSASSMVDTILPTFAISHVADGTNGWNRHSPVVEAITASDAGSGLAGAPTCMDGASAVTVSAAGAGKWSVSVVGASVHSLSCTVRDVAGNARTLTDTVKIDLTAPVITAASRTVDPTGASGIRLTTYGFSVSDTQDPAPSLVCTPPLPRTFPVGSTTTVKCTATDAAGNSTLKSVTFTVRGPLALLQALNAALDTAVPKLGVVIKAMLHLKLTLAISYVSGRTPQACTKLAEFNARIAQERIDPHPEIGAAQAATFTASANLIRAVLRC